jgi:uncharacterized membrane protein HdeD (DUF308 family)
MKTPVTPREWAFQIALSALIALVAGFFFPEKRVILVILLITLAIVSWVIMTLSMRRHRDSGSEQDDETE